MVSTGRLAVRLMVRANLADAGALLRWSVLQDLNLCGTAWKADASPLGQGRE